MNIFYKKINNSKPPSSKSICNRLLFLSFLDGGNFKIFNYLNSVDTNIMIKNLKILGLLMFRKKNFIYTSVVFKKLFFKFFFKNAGTCARPILFYLMTVNQKKNIFLDGDSHMRKRPLLSIYNIFVKIFKSNKKIFFKNFFNFPIFLFKGKCFFKKNFLFYNEYISSQFLSSFFLCLKFKKFYFFYKNIVSYNYFFLTLNIISYYGLKFVKFGNSLFFYYFKKNKKNFFLKPDIISCSYYFLNIFFLKKKFNTFLSKNDIQSEFFIINILKSVFLYFYKFDYIKCVPYVRNVRSISIDCFYLIDSSILFTIFFLINIKFIKLYNIYNWSFKECNRIRCISKELKKIGCLVYFGKNWIFIEKKKIRKNFFLKTYNDHRIALCFFNFFNFKISINNPNCIKKTFPNFFK
ncbi:hypothetical protein ACT2CI_00575 [Candidatus Vidania fulgoroideorum]